ncbi:MAG: aromatic ring-hydroxylating dioxygenase subunit alpha [Deltaproteobacteria bacterium]|nr:MAG: aromatic ring-hydroxylating dioxygenase subunit alpha [Deltaproteobacteria bacterium]
MTVTRKHFWYVVATSDELTRTAVLGRKVLDEWLVVFRGKDGRAAVLRDRCMHRHAPLSKGALVDGTVQCSYHGWRYDSDGVVVGVPAEGARFKQTKRRCAKTFTTREQDGFVYVRLADDGPQDIEPFAMPFWGDPNWRHIRLVNTFANNVTNCAENFIDVPHTVFVHPGIFRTSAGQKITADIRRHGATVDVHYYGETSNLGWFKRFLNPDDAAIGHRDSFHAPNVTEVEYVFGPKRRMFIISQSVPEEDMRTRVYTTLSYDFGRFSRSRVLDAFTKRILRFQGQAVIDQDLDALAEQGEVIDKYGVDFNNTSADAIHVLVESLQQAIADGTDPRTLPEKKAQIEFVI